MSRSASVLENIGRLFYIVDQKTTTFQHEKDVPNYLNEALPYFMLLIVVEWLVTYIKIGKTFRLGDCLTSQGHGICRQVAEVVWRGFEFLGYQWLYERRLVHLDWDSSLVWWMAALGADFGYYWFHRAVHELHLGWSSHQVHHSSEDYNISTALRQSMFQRLFAFGFYQPLALLGVPLPAILVHYQFNLLYQVWIHTELVDRLGPLEWVFNTPSHHRVHHGSNKWCLDKNYGGTLIIWDRIFGTFAAERDDEPVVYGLVDQPQTFNVIWLQFFYIGHVFKKFWKMETFEDKMRALFFGPGWTPGSPRLGDMDMLPDKWPQRPKYDPQIPLWLKIYIIVHFFVVILVQRALLTRVMGLTYISILFFMMFIFVSLATIGGMYDGWMLAPLLETARCITYIVYFSSTYLTTSAFLDGSLMVYMAMSSFMWGKQTVKMIYSLARKEMKSNLS
ncbi:unnamed protein product [Meganyctiphanes norvegica]|uniref:Alkylglycerol monooxygenase n=1 Tax=Meganyctiphanes norvegica TaxID=48144 RepID=A0AAV2RVH3_MEGNR